MSDGILLSVGAAHYDVNNIIHVGATLQLFGTGGTNNYHSNEKKSSLIVIEYPHCPRCCFKGLAPYRHNQSNKSRG
jgi:hypothetical protein